MASHLIPFQFHSTTVSTITDDKGEPWFIAADVCAVLDVKNVSDALTRLKPHEKNTIVLNDGNRGNPETLIINESGFYKLVLRSRKKIAEEFQCWVTEEVLPQIRKAGKFESAAPTPAQAAVAIAQAVLAVEQRVDTLEAQSKAQAMQLAAITERQPPADKARIEDWLRRHSKPFLPKPVLAHLRALCRDSEEPVSFRPDGYDYPCYYYSPYTIAAAYEQATRQLSFLSREAPEGYGRGRR